jgi:diguanylate cyclase (GGDEF)-like protein/PAS domain S-box-containing protein
VTRRTTDPRLAELIQELRIDDSVLQQRLAYVGFGDEDARCLAGIVLPAGAAGFLDGFYSHLQAFDEPAALLGGDNGVERLKQVQSAYFSRLFSGRYDLDYMADRLRVGMVHQRVGLAPGWYLGAYASYLCALLPSLERACGDDGARFLAVTQALVKLIFFDVGVALEAYFVEEKKALLQARRQAEVTFLSAPMSLAVLDPRLHVMRANPAFLRLVGCPAEQVLQEPLLSLLRAESLADNATAALASDAAPRNWSTRVSRPRIDVSGGASELNASITCVHVPFQDGSGVLLIIEDLSEQARLQQSLRESEETLLRAQGVAGIGSWRLDLTHGDLRWTPETYRIFGRPADQGIDYPTFLACVHPDDRERVDHAWQAALAGSHYHVEHRVVSGGVERWVEGRAEVFRDRTGQPRIAVGTVQDITERKFAAQRIEQLAFYDALTGLPNRVLFMERVQQALVAAERQSQRVALLYLDIDRFKEINDAEGHKAGDRVLTEVARRLHAVVGPQALAARLSSDEFGVLLTEDDEAGTKRLMSAIHRALATKTRQYAEAVPAAIGVAYYPDDAATAQDLLAHAEIAMRQAKARGTKHYFYKKQHGESQRRRYALARALERALAAGELGLHYQPQVSVHDGRLSGVEALARWHDPQRGWISPAEFIPVAESHGLIREVGRLALREAAAQAAAWRAAGTPLPGRIAVNVSARQFDNGGFFEDTLAVVREAGATPADIELEITETGLMRDPQHAVDLTRALAGAGFTIAVDDFGTGYSSLVQLKRLPVGKLKIDMSLVRDMLTDKSDHAIVETIVAMGRSLGIATVAEGVESTGQAEALCQIGCSYVQGYLFSRPLSADDFEQQWLGARTD